MPQPRASVSMSSPMRELPPLEKPVREMSEQEKEEARKKVVAHLEEQAAAGNSNVLPIEIDAEGFKGTIRIRRPSLDEERKIGCRSAQYLGGAVGVDIKTENLAIFFATFDILVEWDTAPAWFKPREMYEYELLNHIYGRFAEWLRTFRRFVPPTPTADSEVAGSTAQVVGAEDVPGSSNG